MTESKVKIEGAAKDEDLSVLRMVVKPVNKMLAVNELVLRNNVRDESEYNLPPLIESFKKNGFRPSAPLVIHVGDDNLYEVLAGNRRTNALRTLTPEELNEVLAATDGKVPCLVYSNLTPAQREILRCDHGTDEDRQPLSKFGQFIAVGRLLIAGLTQTQIAERLGMHLVKDGVKKPNRSIVQIYANAAALPDRVKAMLKAYWLRGEGTIRQSDIATLSKVWNEEFPNFGMVGKEGPKFRAKVQEILDRNPDEKQTTARSLSPSAATEKAKVMTSPTTRQLLVAATQTDGSALAQLDKELSMRDQLLREVDWLFMHRKKQIEKLLADAKEALQKVAEAEAAATETPAVE